MGCGDIFLVYVEYNIFLMIIRCIVDLIVLLYYDLLLLEYFLDCYSMWRIDLRVGKGGRVYLVVWWVILDFDSYTIILLIYNYYVLVNG
jgi:hypothetical protein